MILDRAASGKVERDHEGGSLMEGWSLGPFGICDYDGPETVRFRKYATGTHLLLEEIEVEIGATPREVVWTKNKAKLFRYLRPDDRPGKGVGRRRSVPVLLTYGFVLKPYVLDLVPGNSVVEYLVEEGFDVYMLDFGISDAEDVGLSLSTNRLFSRGISLWVEEEMPMRPIRIPTLSPEQLVDALENLYRTTREARLRTRAHRWSFWPPSGV